jgi:hypothetical protein
MPACGRKLSPRPWGPSSPPSGAGDYKKAPNKFSHHPACSAGRPARPAALHRVGRSPARMHAHSHHPDYFVVASPRAGGVRPMGAGWWED